MKKNYLIGLWSLICFTSSVWVQAQVDTIKNTDQEVEARKWNFYVKGFVQADYMLNVNEMRAKDGFDATSISSGPRGKVDDYFSVRQSQFGIGVKSPSKKQSAYVEIDLVGKGGTTKPRLRHAYVELGSFLIGKYWSNFSDLDTWPNIFDFAGPNGALFVRNIQVRYTKQLNKNSKLAVSLENPFSPSITLPVDSLNWKQKTYLPSFVSTYRFGNEKLYYKIGAILTPINYESRNTIEEPYKKKMILGAGLALSGGYNFPSSDNVKFQTSFGNGITTNNVVLNGSGFDAIPNVDKDNEVNTLFMFNILGSYEHRWSPKWTSVAYYSISKISKEPFIKQNNIPKIFQNMAVNLIYNPIKRFRIGAEANYGSLQTFASNKAVDAIRFQFSSSYSF